MIERVFWGDTEYAIIIRATHTTEGIEFFTPPTYSQQLALMQRPRGYVIDPHHHNTVDRKVTFTSEVLFIRRGCVRVDFFDISQAYVDSRVLNTSDVILLISGGHGFSMLEDSEIVEVKQGPYVGDLDKTRFTPNSSRQ